MPAIVANYLVNKRKKQERINKQYAHRWTHSPPCRVVFSFVFLNNRWMYTVPSLDTVVLAVIGMVGLVSTAIVLTAAFGARKSIWTYSQP